MDADNTGDLGFRHGTGSLLNCCSTLQSGVNPSFGSGWDPLTLLVQEGSLMASSHKQIASSHLLQYPSDPCFVELLPKHENFGSGSFSQMVSSFGLRDGGQIANVCSGPDFFPSNKDHGTLFQEDCQISDDGAVRPSPTGKKRKKVSDVQSQLDTLQSAGPEHQKDDQQETLDCPKEWDEKKRKTEQIPGPNSHDKLTDKQYSSHNGEEASKEDYIHVRARRGQATNSHSLAERVRREKISERMRFLQDLVPGCNKITGKAVMLDEIINYVQSLQQQVEFLSMKLATVNPELNIDIERILSDNILHSQGGAAAILGFSPGTSSHPHQQVTPQGASQVFRSTNPHFLPMSQIPNVWDDELQSAIQMGFNPNRVTYSLGQDGSMKVEL